MVANGLLAAASFLIFLFALQRAGAGAVFTLRNTSIVFAQLFSWALGERPTQLPVAVDPLRAEERQVGHAAQERTWLRTPANRSVSGFSLPTRLRASTYSS